MNIIATTGKKGAGKDSFGTPFLAAGYEQVRFADALKDMIAIIFRYWGYDEATIVRKIEGDLKEEPCEALAGKTPRWAMQSLGTEWRDLIHKDLWTNITRRRLLLDSAPEQVIVTDCRFPHEQDFLREFGGKLIRVYRPVGRTKEGEEHSSETLIDKLSPDYHVYNHGTLEDLRVASDIIRTSIEDSISIVEVVNND